MESPRLCVVPTQVGRKIQLGDRSLQHAVTMSSVSDCKPHHALPRATHSVCRRRMGSDEQRRNALPVNPLPPPREKYPHLLWSFPSPPPPLPSLAWLRPSHPLTASLSRVESNQMPSELRHRGCLHAATRLIPRIYH